MRGIPTQIATVAEIRAQLDRLPDTARVAFALRFVPEPAPAHIEIARPLTEEGARALVVAGYQQTSGKYGLITRLPPGLTGIEAAEMYDPFAFAHLCADAERGAAMMFRRCGRTQELGCQMELTREELKLFRSVGGQAA